MKGVVLCYLPKSPIMTMVALLAGIQSVTYTVAEAPDEFDETIALMERKADEAADQVPPGARWERIHRVSQLVEQYGRYD